MSIKIKFIDRKDIDDVLEFQNNAQSDRVTRNSRQRKEFEWLFFNGPVAPAIYACATDSTNGDIIGTQAGIFIPMINSANDKLITIKGEDTLISLERASKLGTPDILKELLNSIAEKSKEFNADLIWGLTPARSAFRRCGFAIETQIKNSFYVIKPIAFYRNRVSTLCNISSLMKLKLFIFSIFNIVSRQFKHIESSEISLKCIPIDNIREDLIASFIPKGVYTLDLNKDYLRWRIKDNPSGVKYELLEAVDNKGEIVSYIILSHDKENIWYIDHFLFSDKLSSSIKSSVISKAFRYAKSKGAIFIKAPGFDHNSVNRADMKLLANAGSYFFKNPGESYFVFKSLSDKMINPEDIYLSRLNTQGIR